MVNPEISGHLQALGQKAHESDFRAAALKDLRVQNADRAIPDNDREIADPDVELAIAV